MTKPQAEVEQAFPDYYQVLHLHADADAAMVDQAYWHLARLYNASIRSDSEAGTKLEELNEAYSVLRSSAMRREYDEARNALLDEDGLLAETAPEPDAPPLAVMAKQRPKAKKAKKDPKEKTKRRWLPAIRLPSLSIPSVKIQRLSIPPWQSVAGAVVIVVLAGAALVTGTSPALVAALLIFGLAVTMLPLVRKLPGFPAFPASALRLPAIRAPRLPDRPTRPGVNADSLRQSTEAMRARWRVGTEGISASLSPLSSDEPASAEPASIEATEPDEPQEDPHTPVS